MLFGRNAWPRLLFDWWYAGWLAVEDLRAVLPDAWCEPEWPQRQLTVAGWSDLFRVAGFVSDGGQTPPSSPLAVHRGATWGRRRGMAWTTDRERAAWFAARREQHGLVFTVTVEPDAVLAMIDGRDEHEIVVDPSMLPPVRRRADDAL